MTPIGGHSEVCPFILRSLGIVSRAGFHRRGPAGEVQKKSAELVKMWGKLKEPRGPVDQRASEKFFSRTFEPMPRALNGHRRGAPAPVQAATSATRRDGCCSSKRTHAPRHPGPLPGGLLARV